VESTSTDPPRPEMKPAPANIPPPERSKVDPFAPETVKALTAMPSGALPPFAFRLKMPLIKDVGVMEWPFTE
jgi:hypothetical protein